MPGVACNCLNTIQPIFGCDGHKTIPPPPPAPPPFAPHIVVWMLGGALPMTSKKAPTVEVGWGYSVARQHDCGIGPYHFWPNVLLPVIWLGAGNKSNFASGTVKIPTGDMAVAVVPMVGINFQLDCWDFPFPPLPTSIVVASFTTVAAGFTLADFIGGLLGMLVDMICTWVLAGITNSIASALGKVMEKGLSGLTSAVFRDLFRVSGTSSPAFGTAARMFTSWWSVPANAVPAVAGVLLGWFGIGSPMGYSSEYSVGGHEGSLNEIVHDLVEPPAGK